VSFRTVGDEREVFLISRETPRQPA
jgi:hypothetical protein